MALLTHAIFIIYHHHGWSACFNLIDSTISTFTYVILFYTINWLKINSKLIRMLVCNLYYASQLNLKNTGLLLYMWCCMGQWFKRYVKIHYNSFNYSHRLQIAYSGHSWSNLSKIATTSWSWIWRSSCWISSFILCIYI